MKDREKIVYDRLMKLRNGDVEERTLAFECDGILGNESSNESLENRIARVESKIKKHDERKGYDR